MKQMKILAARNKANKSRVDRKGYLIMSQSMKAIKKMSSLNTKIEIQSWTRTRTKQKMRSKTIYQMTTSKTKTILRLTFTATKKKPKQMAMKRSQMLTNQIQRNQLINMIITSEQIPKWCLISQIKMPRKKKSRTMKNRKCQAQAQNHQQTKSNQAVQSQVLNKKDKIEPRRNKTTSSIMNLIRNKFIQTRQHQVLKDHQQLQLKEPFYYQIRKKDRKFRLNYFHQNQMEQRLSLKHIKLKFKERSLQLMQAILDQNRIKLLIHNR